MTHQSPATSPAASRAVQPSGTERKEEFELSFRGRRYAVWRQGGGNWQMRVTKNKKQHWKSLGSPIRDIATKQARIWLEALFSETWEQQLPHLSYKAKPQSTFGELVAIYKKHAPTELDIAQKTVTRNAARLLGILRELFPGNDHVEDLRLEELTTERIREYVRKSRDAKRDDVSIRSSIAQARSVYTPKLAHIYAKELKMPARLPQFAGLNLDTSREGFVPISPTVVAHMESAVPELEPNVRRCYLLMARLGMRNVEVAACRRHWFESHGGKRLLVIKDRPEENFAVKNSLPGALEVSDELWHQLTHDLPPRWSHIIDLDNKTAREQVCYRDINEFVRKYLPEREKGAYELRKWAGSIIATTTGNLYLAQQFLRHKSIKTTEAYYATYLKSVAGVTLSDIAAIYSGPAVRPSLESTAPAAAAPCPPAPPAPAPAGH